jgi:hypothetical protein
MVLGCHDLSIFNNRNWRNTGSWRKGIKNEFRALSKNESPTLVLHHPHTTVKVTTWRNAWNNLKGMLPTVKEFAGAGRYSEPDRKKSEYDPLDEVLESTKKGHTTDFIIKRKQ